ncbi:MAG: HAD family hydrolase [Pseudomonadota bacterium]
MTVKRIAMWSGPRNISTAMMRAWENRNDTFVTDEPFYACYLNHTGIEHPGRAEILANQSTHWEVVIDDCLSLTQDQCAIHYQKHMTQHMLPHLRLDWLDKLVNVFLIRSPAEVIASYSQARPDLTAEDIGFAQQHRLYQHVKQHVHSQPLVMSSKQVLSDPAAALKKICRYCEVEFTDTMLQWPAGSRDSDGIWAPYWYSNVEQSTGFAPYQQKNITLDNNQQRIAERCEPYYQAMLELSN